ncbi:Nicotinate-nucleotide adenylyltransferase [Thalassovita gelatinovora]|uniref:Probable nicotinate-nucleotide adenylyltransferase n=1 Tax=Thalassovita gelatinovora TaxID=53501 RepID=A0A0P1G533_THAGE|nr:nicotinate-nucleotide adenylyltransferase [Thalassovita gelatinovora]QIZ81923.1 nicotinate-nucleotide adenylyltransferase [Thalassovita gelatinovora]CUH67294.1 Nicotinate-nucleotide adenylyltransferase [Thalassovita gelatinovora]SEP76797.1 nicotinate-nucleotide adenylyltransferase [Thalassovita gelatinovora]
MRYQLPYARAGQVIGLLGGSFDPAHDGHAHITREALKRFGLDQVWWLVSPGNPLKEKGPADLQRRMEMARRMIDHPRVKISDFEARIGTRFTAETIAALQQQRPDVNFVWLMGADNLVQFDQWQDWRDIVARVPIGVLARPRQRISARASKTARVFRAARLPAQASHLLGHCPAPCWCFVNVPMVAVSSTMIRERGDWG